MSKRNKIFLSIWILVYVIALVIFHTTYSFTKYWIEESSIVLSASLFYIVIGLILYLTINRKNNKIELMHYSPISVKGATKIVTYTCALKAVLYLWTFCNASYYDYIHPLNIHPLIYIVAWITISVFFFTLHKNMN